MSIPNLQSKQRALCPRCNHTLSIYHRNDVSLALSLAISALIFLLLSLPFNFLTFRANGQFNSIDLPGGLNMLIEQDYVSLALITGLATLVLPGLVLLGLVVLLTARLTTPPRPWMKTVLSWVMVLLPWSMAEIFLLGTLVSLIKITSMADIAVGMSFYAFVGFSLSMSAALFYFDEVRLKLWLYAGDLPVLKPLSKQTASLSIQRTWALLFTALLLYIPANTLPIMSTELFGSAEKNTIMGGVISLWQSGSYPIAMVIFFASIVIPAVKLVVLARLNYAVQHYELTKPKRQTQYYRFIELIGRWSMIDVFVVAILVALIQLGSTLSIHPGPAALAFCALVFITMLAAMTFDSRLIWQQRDKPNL
ncbi:paraquat-inducible protein A [Alteromonas gilva]|uniref:Paraquat-inducible protein A n=1 Tax=Alteromonas gilva TaxID=2987522 RepID=A0ABT5L414_9ALTE|nr:paraquat-inducible protein A [Alteromonas gilva]MDC8831783.1 paraquat-inducible protein A [Alteromonas gilva]